MKRIAICTPIDRRSAIARATLDMAAALADRVDITIIAEPTDHPLVCPFALRSLHHVTDDELRGFDRLITVLGDSHFHRQTVDVARRIPSVVILHDVLLGHLAVWAMDPSVIDAELRRWYGASATLGGVQAFWDSELAMNYPFFEPLIENAVGVVVHSTFAAAQVRPRTVAPLAVIPLAYRSAAHGAHGFRPNSSEGSDGPVIVTLGHANKNKCHELVIEAVAALGDSTVKYVIAGPIAPDRRRSLLNAAEASGVSDQVSILGEISDDAVQQVLQSATIFVNLRNPALEGASASLIEQMAMGRAVVVFDHGCYADAPDDTVIKVAPTTSADELATILRQQLDDPDSLAAIGGRAAAHIEAEHSFDRYAERLVQFFDDVDGARPAVDLVHSLASKTRSWGMSSASALFGRWAAEIDEMMGATSPDWP